MFWAAVSYFITVLGTQLTNYLTSLDITPLQGALISTGVGLGVVMVGVLIDHARDPGQDAAPSSAQRAGRTSLAAALVMILLLCGGGGLAITYGAQWAAGKVTALIENVTGECKVKPGQERLAAPVSKKNGVLTVTVNSVQVNDCGTVINLTARNNGGTNLTLTRGSCQLAVPGKPTLEPDHFVGSWGNGDVASNGGERNGTIAFDGLLGADTKKVTLAFTTIFGSGFDGPRDISIDIALT